MNLPTQGAVDGFLRWLPRLDRMHPTLLAALPAGPAAAVAIQLKTLTNLSGNTTTALQYLYINLNATVSFQSLAQMLGINWPFSSDILAISNPAFTFVANPYRLVFAATISIPFLAFKNRATLIIDGQDSFGVSVRQLLCHLLLRSM